MLDIKFIRENPEKIKQGLKKRLFTEVKLVDEVTLLDKKRSVLLIEVENLRMKKNKASNDRNIEEGKKIKEELKTRETEFNEVENELKDLLYKIPNVPADDVPEGPEENKKVLKKFGEPKKFDFQPLDHVDLGLKLGIVDIERASKISGSRFAYLEGDGVLLEFALINFALSKLMTKGFVPLLPPMIIKKEITDDLGYWHGGGNENYYFLKDYENTQKGKQEREMDLYLVGTGEHSTVPMYAKEILNEKDLPKKYVTFSSCFRREAGTYGKDTKGILRLHQFDKVEMIELVKPEDDEKVHEEMLSFSEELMQELNLPYQVVILAAGDIGFPTAKTYDIETWLPGQNKYRETHSISTTTDYQARRLEIKYRGADGNKFVHILNGTAFAIGRTIIAILENYQNSDGSVNVPEVLQNYVGKKVLTP